MKVDYTLSHNFNVFLGIIADPLLKCIRLAPFSDISRVKEDFLESRDSEDKRDLR